jgi:formate dehydrogenase-N gamma subunit
VIGLGLIIHAILIHLYMAFWVKGSITGMVEGKASPKWAKMPLPCWYRKIVAEEEKSNE